MNDLIGRVFDFEATVFPNKAELYQGLATKGQKPKALIVSCADSRIVPEQILQADPGELFVCRNAGNIVPPYAGTNEGVVATIEYAVAALGIRDIVVCGHYDCGAMKGLGADPATLSGLPAVRDWLAHGRAARAVADAGYADLDSADRLRALTLENVVAQIANLRTHPAVAAGLAKGEITLHGWYVDIHAGEVLALDGGTGRFAKAEAGRPLPVAHAAGARFVAEIDAPVLEAAE